VDALRVFLHSTGSGPALWDGVPPAVASGAQKVTPANVGYAPGPPLPRPARCDLRTDARHVLRQLEGAAPLHLFAHSYGAVLALELLPLLGERVRSVLLFEPVLFGALAHDGSADPEAVAEARGFLAHPWFLTDEARAGSEPWLEFFIDYWNRPGTWRRLPRATKDANLAVGWKMFQEVRSVFFDVSSFEERPLTAAPCTLVMAERSPRAARAMVQALARRTPHAQVVELKGTGHMAPLTHPEVLGEAMLAHLGRAG